MSACCSGLNATGGVSGVRAGAGGAGRSLAAASISAIAWRTPRRSSQWKTGPKNHWKNGTRGGPSPTSVTSTPGAAPVGSSGLTVAVSGCAAESGYFAGEIVVE